MEHTRTMSVIENSKLAIVGAGAVGTSLAYAALIRESAREVALYDINSAKVAAEVLDLAHGTQFTGASRVTGGDDLRSEEHTSELQSRMSISYAVFCLDRKSVV